MGKISAGKRKNRMKNMQKLGEILMSVIAVMPAAGLMISLGKVFQITGSGEKLLWMAGRIMENIGWAIINNLHILFAVAIGGAGAKNRAGGAFAAIIAFILAWIWPFVQTGINRFGIYVIQTGANAGTEVFGQDPLWLAWVTDLIHFKTTGNMEAYQHLLTTVTPARFKAGQMIGSTGLLPV